MDREQEETQLLGFVSVHKEDCKTTHSWMRIFTQITLTLILPLSLIFFIHINLSNLFFKNIQYNPKIIVIDETNPNNTPQYHELIHTITSQWITVLLIHITYFTWLLTYSLLSSSLVAYTITLIYTSKDETFENVMSLVPRVWTRVTLTSLCAIAAFTLCSFGTLIVSCSMLYWADTVGIKSGDVLVLVEVLYFIGFVYLILAWQLSCVVTMLEDSWGFRRTAKKIEELIKGEMVLLVLTVFALVVSLASIRILFQEMEVVSVDETAYWGICLAHFLCLLFFGTVQMLLYCTCKSYCYENSDNSGIEDHVEVFLGEYVPLKAKEVQPDHVNLMYESTCHCSPCESLIA